MNNWRLKYATKKPHKWINDDVMNKYYNYYNSVYPKFKKTVLKSIR